MTNLTPSLTHSAMPALYESLRSNLFTAQQDREVLRLHTYPCAERKLNFPFCFYQVAEWFKPPIYEAQASKIGKNGWFAVGIPGVRCKCFAMPGSFWFFSVLSPLFYLLGHWFALGNYFFFLPLLSCLLSAWQLLENDFTYFCHGKIRTRIPAKIPTKTLWELKAFPTPPSLWKSLQCRNQPSWSITICEESLRKLGRELLFVLQLCYGTLYYHCYEGTWGLFWCLHYVQIFAVSYVQHFRNAFV